MLQFQVNQPACIRCGECVFDCPSRIIGVDAGYPAIPAEKQSSCIRCEHCLTVCPTGAISILGYQPADSMPIEGNLPDPVQLETLIKARRSVRRYREENVEPELVQRMLNVAWHAPTGVNSRQVLFTVLDDREKVARLRDEVMEGLVRLSKENAIPKSMAYFSRFVRVWERQKVDLIFRDAPHLLIATAPKGVACPKEDCLIALSYFELFAQANGVGTVWNGLVKWAFDLLPEARKNLGIPEDHLFGYSMTFGIPAVRYARTVQHSPALINRPM
ncbi:MAG: 4Fe-4S binding protein [Chlorobiaceae bacterium]|nr:4Fe-4S binding protein [Chlorobiaceae bacterium]